MRLSKKLQGKLDRLRYVGYFTARGAEERNMRLVTGREGKLVLYWLVDEADGIISDAKFQAFGPVGLIAVGEIASELALRKNYDQVSRISAELLDHFVRDQKEIPAFPQEAHAFLNTALSAIDSAVHQCIDIPYAAADYTTTPIAWDLAVNPDGVPGWENLTISQKTRVLEEVIDKEIRPYIELDAGGVRIVELKESGEVHIAYEGSCTTCHSSTGSTLSAIQQIIKARIHPSLTVVPVF